jgi:hypothetical protein
VYFREFHEYFKILFIFRFVHLVDGNQDQLDKGRFGQILRYGDPFREYPPLSEKGQRIFILLQGVRHEVEHDQ